jgi:cytochrome oxidase Cu insertion factor (SCO1/SenC/PrrC family)
MAEDKPTEDSKELNDAAVNGDQPAKPVKRKSGARLLLLLVGIVVLAFAIAVVGYDYFAGTANKSSTSTATSSGPSVGGPFELVGQNGKTVTEKDFDGKYMMIYFGYTYCPDVCPTALSDMATALDAIDPEKAAKVQPIFISVDPARDTPEHLAEYVSFFHPRLIGLTGSEKQVKEAARAYRVFYRIGEPQSDDPQDYLVDHTSIIYLVGPDGKLVTHFSHGTTPEAMAERLGKLL